MVDEQPPPDERKVFVLEPLGDDPEVGRWLAALEDGRRDTIRELSGVTPEMLDWRPERLLNSIGTLLYHIALIETSWLLDDIFEGDPGAEWLQTLLPFTDRDASGRLIQVEGLPVSAHLGRLGRVRQYLLEHLRPMSNDDFHRVRHLEAYDAAPDWVIHHLLQHEAEHRSHIAWLRDSYVSDPGRSPLR